MTARRPPGRPAGGVPIADRDHLLDAAERVIRRDGADASLSAIAAEAGVTKPVVYARVGGRAELASALAERFTTWLVDGSRVEIEAAATPRDALVAMIRVALDQVEEHRELFLYVTAGNSPDDRLSLASMAVEPMSRQLERWGQDRQIPIETAEAWSVAIVGMINFVALWWATDADRPPEVLAAQLAELLWSGIGGGRPSP